MTEYYPISSAEDELITGTHVDIQLGPYSELSTRLSDPNTHQTYLNETNEDKLPYPARAVSLESWPSAIEDQPVMQAAVSFRPTDFENNPEMWPGAFLEELKEHLQTYDYQPETLRHDPLSLYIALDMRDYIRVALKAEPDECSIQLSIGNIGNLTRATHHPLDNPSNNPSEPLTRLLHVSTVLCVAIDQLRMTFGNPPKHPKRYKLEQFNSAYPDDRSTSDQLSGLVDMPESETNVSDEYGLDYIGGATAAKRRLRDIADVFDDPEAATEYGVSSGHVLLHGPPGTGKTTIAQAFAHEVGATFWSISSTDLVSKWVGESGWNVADTFDKAREVDGKLVLFFDEFDALAQKGSSGTTERLDIRKVLNVQLEEISKNHPNIIVLAATNFDLGDLEPSLIRSGRLEAIEVPCPNAAERIDVWSAVFFKSLTHFNKDNFELFDSDGNELKPTSFVPYDDSIDVVELAQHSDGMTGADFEEILRRARQERFHEYRQTDVKMPVSQGDVLREIRNFYR